MNKRDLKNLAKETAEQTVDPNKIPVYSREDFMQVVHWRWKSFVPCRKISMWMFWQNS